VQSSVGGRQSVEQAAALTRYWGISIRAAFGYHIIPISELSASWSPACLTPLHQQLKTYIALSAIWPFPSSPVPRPSSLPQYTESSVSEFFMPSDSRLLQDGLDGTPAASLTIDLRSVMHRDLRTVRWLSEYPNDLDCILFPEVVFAGLSCTHLPYHDGGESLHKHTTRPRCVHPRLSCADRSSNDVSVKDETFFSTSYQVKATALVSLPTSSDDNTKGELKVEE